MSVSQTHGAVGSAGGGQNDGWNTGRRFTEPVIEPSGCLSGGKNRPNRSLFDQPCNIVALRFTDARISGALDAAARKHVPESDAVPQGEGAPRTVVRRRLLAEEGGERRPEAVLRMQIIKIPRPRGRGGHGAQNQHP